MVMWVQKMNYYKFIWFISLRVFSFYNVSSGEFIKLKDIKYTLTRHLKCEFVWQFKWENINWKKVKYNATKEILKEFKIESKGV